MIEYSILERNTKTGERHRLIFMAQNRVSFFEEVCQISLRNSQEAMRVSQQYSNNHTENNVQELRLEQAELQRQIALGAYRLAKKVIFPDLDSFKIENLGQSS